MEIERGRRVRLSEGDVYLSLIFGLVTNNRDIDCVSLLTSQLIQLIFIYWLLVIHVKIAGTRKLSFYFFLCVAGVCVEAIPLVGKYRHDF
jgi:hypothetical protein